jgi:thiol-disulfide isomerase/thioredoxin
VVELAGSWCAACRSAAPFLVELYREYQPRGLHMVSLRYEFSDDRVFDAVQAEDVGFPPPPPPPSSAASRPSSARTSRSCWRARALRAERTDLYDEALITSSRVACVSRFPEPGGARKI